MDRQHTLPEEIRYQLKLITGISLGIFLFMLFFLPLEHREMEFNNNLLYIIGLGLISFVIMGIFRIILPSTLEKLIKLETYKISNEVVNIIFIWIFNATTYLFYMHYVGALELSLFAGTQIVLFASFPSIILKLADVNKSLRDQLKHIVVKNVRLGKYVPDEKIIAKPTETFFSDSNSEKIEIHPDDIMLVKSADNYVNIIYKDGNEVRQKMLRNTLTKILSQLRKHPEFVRCHRTCIINSLFIVNLTNNYKGYRLQLLDYEEEIPVSRQYILAVKEYIVSE